MRVRFWEDGAWPERNPTPAIDPSRGSDVNIEAPRVLIVEDHEHTRAVLGRVFHRRGWAVSTVGTVADGLAGLVPSPDCVVLDLNLPDGSGEAVLHAIRAGGLSVQIVAVVTATTDIMRLIGVAAYGPDLTIIKPFDWDVLFRYCDWVVQHT